MDNQRKKRPIYDYYIGDTCYHTLHNRRGFTLNPKALNPFNRPDYRIVDCKTVSSPSGKHIAFSALLSCGQLKVIKSGINDTPKELCKKIRKSLRENEPVVIRFGEFDVFPFVSPFLGRGTTIFTDNCTIANISTKNLTNEELEYYTAPFTKKEWIYEANEN